MKGFDLNMEFSELANSMTTKSREQLDNNLRSFLDNLIATNKYRIDNAEFLKRSCYMYVNLKQIAPNPQTGFNYNVIVHPAPATRNDLMTPKWSRYLPYLPYNSDRSRYIKLRQIAPNPQSGFDHGAIAHPVPATREDMMTKAWSRYLPDLPKPKSPHGWVSCLPHEEDVELREKSAARNKIWYNLFYKKDYCQTENESSLSNVVKKYEVTNSLHDILLTRKPIDDVIASPASSSYSV